MSRKREKPVVKILVIILAVMIILAISEQLVGMKPVRAAQKVAI